MNILALGHWFPATALRHLCDAWERMGHTVWRFGVSYEREIDITWPKQYIVEPVTRLERGEAWDIDELVSICQQNCGNPNFVFACEDTYHNEIIVSSKTPVVLYQVDGWPENYERVEIYKPVIAYTEDPYGIRAYPRETMDSRWVFLPGACAPWEHHIMPVEKVLDCSFYGTMYVNRPILCQYLIKAGLRVAFGKMSTNQAVLAMNQAWVSIHDCNQEDRLKWRLFEGCACGSVMLSDYTRLLPELGFQEWKHYVPCTSTNIEETGEPGLDLEDAESKIRWVIAHESERTRLVAHAYNFVMENHTYYHRANRILADMRPYL